MKQSPTWPYVCAFALGMEAQLDAHRERGNREAWITTSPDDLFHGLIEQAHMASELLMRLMMTPPTISGDGREELMRRLVHIANFAMMTADSAGLLPILPIDAVQRIERIAIIAELRSARAAEHERDVARVAIGANEGESLENALIRYTAAVRLGCAMELEKYMEAIGLDRAMDKRRVRNVADELIAVLRRGVPSGQTSGDAIDRWKAEQSQAFADEVVVEISEWWAEQGDIGADALKELQRRIQSLVPGDPAMRRQEREIERYGVPEDTILEAGPEDVQDEQPRPDPDNNRPGVTDEGRAEGCLDPLCGDCDMK